MELLSWPSIFPVEIKKVQIVLRSSRANSFEDEKLYRFSWENHGDVEIIFFFCENFFHIFIVEFYCGKMIRFSSSRTEKDSEVNATWNALFSCFWKRVNGSVRLFNMNRKRQACTYLGVVGPLAISFSRRWCKWKIEKKGLSESVSLKSWVDDCARPRSYRKRSGMRARLSSFAEPEREDGWKLEFLKKVLSSPSEWKCEHEMLVLALAFT